MKYTFKYCCIFVLAFAYLDIAVGQETFEESIQTENVTGTFSKKIVPGGGVKRQTLNYTPKQVSYCFTVQREATKMSDKCGLMTTRTDIYPGNIFTGKNLLRGSYTILPNKRNAVKIYIPNIIFEDPASGIVMVNDPSPSNLNEAVMQLIQTPQKGQPQADMLLESTEIYSQADVEFNLDIHARNFFGDFKIENHFSYNEKKTTVKLMLSFVQKYFTAVSDLNHPDSIFYDKLPITNDMTYIRSVTYGRRGFLLIELDTSIREIKDTFEVYKKRSFSLNSDFMQSKSFRNSKVIGYIFGGSSIAGAKVLDSADPKENIQEFYNWINESASFSIDNFGRPIEYELALVKTGELASIEYSINETKKYCEEGNQFIRVKLKSIKALSVDDYGDDEDIYGVLAAYFQTIDKQVIYNRQNRFCRNSEGKEDNLNCFYNGNGDANDAYFRLPSGGVKPIPQSSDQFLWNAQRSQYGKVKVNMPILVDKYYDFLINSDQKATSELVIYGNLDEVDSDDADDRLEGNTSTDELIRIPYSDVVSKINASANKNMVITQKFSSGGTRLTATYEITIRSPQ